MHHQPPLQVRLNDLKSLLGRRLIRHGTKRARTGEHGQSHHAKRPHVQAPGIIRFGRFGRFGRQTFHLRRKHVRRPSADRAYRHRRPHRTVPRRPEVDDAPPPVHADAQIVHFDVPVGHARVVFSAAVKILNYECEFLNMDMDILLSWIEDAPLVFSLKTRQAAVVYKAEC